MTISVFSNIDITGQKMKIMDCGFGSGKGFWSHNHSNQWELHLFISGDGIFYNEGQSMHISTGMLTFSRPLEQHHCEPECDNKTEFYYVGMQFDAADRSLKDSIESVFDRHSHLMLDRSVFSQFGRIIQKSKTENPDIVRSSEHLLCSLLYEIVANNSRNYCGEQSDLASSLLDILHKNTYEKGSLDQIAEQMGFDKSYLIRIFKQKYQITPIKYLLKLKIDAGCYLLDNSQMNIKEIAYKLKFYDEYYFSRKFKELKKCSPRDYRTRGDRSSVRVPATHKKIPDCCQYR